MADSSTARSGFPLLSILTLVFVLAKVFGVAPVAAWSWWWVLAPMWAGAAVVFVFVVVVVVIAALAS